MTIRPIYQLNKSSSFSLIVITIIINNSFHFHPFFFSHFTSFAIFYTYFPKQKHLIIGICSYRLLGLWQAQQAAPY
jgi:hypothetical protein